MEYQMTELIIRLVSASELQTVRIQCRKCGNTAELPLESAARTLSKGNCAFCGHGFWGRNDDSPLEQIQEGLKYLRLLEEAGDLSAQFVIRGSE
jgi:hypothetical protein